ncbi:MAG: thioredoxin family protein [Candidatus Azotimanducaceae bacterium]
MVTLKEFLAFPMFASAVWLAWVLQSQEAGRFLVPALVGVLLIGFGVWLIKQSSNRFARFMALTSFAFALAIPVEQLFSVNPSSSGYKTDQQQIANAFSSKRLEELVEAGPVFVNFTASWCITCKVNEITALGTRNVLEAFELRGITYLVADWSSEDPKITKALEGYGRAGVPLYLLFEKGVVDSNRSPSNFN